MNAVIGSPNAMQARRGPQLFVVRDEWRLELERGCGEEPISRIAAADDAGLRQGGGGRGQGPYG